MMRWAFYVVLAILLVGCMDDGGSVYNHLKQQEVGKFHGYADSGNYSENDTVYDTLNDNLCELSPHCCGEFTETEIYYKDMERRAVVENNLALCDNLPDEELVVECENEDSYIFYSKTRCKEEFS